MSPRALKVSFSLAAQFAGGRDFGHAAVFEPRDHTYPQDLSGIDEETVADCEIPLLFMKKLFRHRFAQISKFPSAARNP